jgi:DNA (cytosine-5)-methyltransferase 1
LGYSVSWGIFSAAECGAPHQRKRVFILAHCKSAGLERYDGLLTGCGEPRRDTSEQAGQVGWSNSSRDAWPSRPGEPQHAWEPPRVVENSKLIGWDGWNHGDETGISGEVQTAGSCGGMGNADSTGSQKRARQRGAGVQRVDSNGGADAERQTEPALGGDTDGPASRLDYAELCVTCDNRTDELRLLGNGVVPATAALAFTTLLNEQRNPRHLA